MVLEDGGVLKPPANALPCLKSLFVDPQREHDALLSIWNECEADGHGVVVRMGKTNISYEDINNVIFMV